MDRLREVVRARTDDALADLQRLLRQPSVAATGEGIPECAALVASLFREAAAQVTVLRTEDAAPLVVALFPGQGARTLLFYDHYDVQPPDPLPEWVTPPFEPAVRDGRLYARGAADNKGDLVSRLWAVRALREARGGLPCRVKFIVEGEEETGSVHLAHYLRAYRDLLAGDACIWEFGERDMQERLNLVAGVKGICYLDLSLVTAARDLHSQYGAIVEGAAMRLIWALATLKDPATGRILVEGFYDRVRPPTPEEEAALRRLPFDEAQRKAYYGVRSWIGGKSAEGAQYDLYFSPTCTICGFTSGYTGPGSKTVLPHRATAKVDFRLVPDQDPQEIAALVGRHLTTLDFGDVEVRLLGGERAYRSPLDDPFVQLVARVAAQATGRQVLLKPTSGGTGPMYPLGSTLRVPIVSLGCSYWASGGHAPNEHIRLADFEETVDLVARIIAAYGEEAV
ncbi:MAG: M20/M25/M40 family metallo-hydrolase [Armatimonadota bacterium]|nr:M20/M25/M40 family metallo-hydrolase [Armatimonadota bacterium]MDR7428251.1 M20/M25/M40 family metallo-hydrolase [Armatimonadota bacterium]MDR7463223.1 M20/M25/M40 family metallo-hydrolase [Armatimonadota bacterium]MDR7469397.1 M20/M25/M40 family metallo-hydrolase [Armatimonadota bacterium]MDR7474767.1 M20/M25/M40 family metallo-hydrolase [Armatimonadota bacterium]